MTILFVLIPLAIILLSVAVFAFFWAVNNEQFDDLDSPAYMVLLDDNIEDISKNYSDTSSNKKSNKEN